MYRFQPAFMHNYFTVQQNLDGKTCTHCKLASPKFYDLFCSVFTPVARLYTCIFLFGNINRRLIGVVIISSPCDRKETSLVLCHDEYVGS